MKYEWKEYRMQPLQFTQDVAEELARDEGLTVEQWVKQHPVVIIPGKASDYGAPEYKASKPMLASDPEYAHQ
jgi:hypothetical protein